MHVEIRGFVGDEPDLPALLARVREASYAHDAPVQVLRADRVWGRAHVERAAELAVRAFASGRHRATELPLEFLSYAAGDRQIARALERLGVRAGRNLPLAGVAFGVRAALALDHLERASGWRRDDEVLRAPKGEDVLEALGVDAVTRAVVPREAWAGLVLERVALVDLPKS